MEERGRLVASEVGDLIRKVGRWNEAEAAHMIARFRQEDNSTTVAPKRVVSLRVGEYDVTGQERPDALILLRVMVSGCPLRAMIVAFDLLESATVSEFSKEAHLEAFKLLTTVVVADYLLSGVEVICEALLVSLFVNSRVRWVATKAMESLLLRCPTCAKEVLLGRHGQYVNDQARRGAAAHLGRLLPVYPEEADDILVSVFSGCNDPIPEVREAAVCQLSAALTASPQSGRRIMDVLLHASNDMDRRVRVAATSQFFAAVEAYPESIGEVFVALREAPFTTNLRRQAARYQCPDVSKLCPNRAKELVVFAFLYHYRLADSDEKVVLAKCFPAAKRFCPSLGEHIVRVLLREEGKSVAVPERRAIVVKSFARLIMFVPSVDNKLISSLFLACNDKHSLVREAAMTQLVSFGKEFPTLLIRCTNTLFRGCGDPSSDVRIEAWCQLRAARQAWARQIDEFIRVVLLRLCDDDSGTRNVAGEQLVAILRSYPSEAIELLGSILHQAARESSGVGRSKRKSCDSPRDRASKKRHAEDDSASLHVSKRKNGDLMSTENKSKKRHHEIDSPESKRKGPRRC